MERLLALQVRWHRFVILLPCGRLYGQGGMGKGLRTRRFNSHAGNLSAVDSAALLTRCCRNCQRWWQLGALRLVRPRRHAAGEHTCSTPMCCNWTPCNDMAGFGTLILQ